MKRLNVVIAGSRSLAQHPDPVGLVEQACFEACGLWNAFIIGVISGHAKGADEAGERFAEKYHLPLTVRPADWDNITVPGAVIRIRGNGRQYNVVAGHMRNETMAIEADAAVLLWNGKSTGTMDMKKRMEQKGKIVHVKNFA